MYSPLTKMRASGSDTRMLVPLEHALIAATTDKQMSRLIS
jgi:hypothetical protein